MPVRVVMALGSTEAIKRVVAEGVGLAVVSGLAVDEVVADRSYDSEAIRCRLIDERTWPPQIPNHPRRATKFVKTLPAK